MLVLTRKVGEKVVIGSNITITVVETEGGRIRIGIDAPNDIRILRGELAFWMESGDRQAKQTSGASLGQ